MKQQLFLSVITIFISLVCLQEAKAQSLNTWYGELALSSNTTGDYNSAFGDNA